MSLTKQSTLIIAQITSWRLLHNATVILNDKLIVKLANHITATYVYVERGAKKQGRSLLRLVTLEVGN